MNKYVKYNVHSKKLNCELLNHLLFFLSCEINEKFFKYLFYNSPTILSVY